MESCIIQVGSSKIYFVDFQVGNWFQEILYSFQRLMYIYDVMLTEPTYLKNYLVKIARRLRGIHIFGSGIEWGEPPELERDVAISLIVNLEDFRVLFFPDAHNLQKPSESCRKSMVRLRRFLTSLLEKLEQGPEKKAWLAQRIMNIKEAVVNYSSKDFDESPLIKTVGHSGFKVSPEFESAITELRKLIGIEIGKIGKKYRLEIPKGLTKILPKEEPMEKK